MSRIARSFPVLTFLAAGLVACESAVPPPTPTDEGPTQSVKSALVLGCDDPAAVFRPCNVVETAMAYVECKLKQPFGQLVKGVAACDVECDQYRINATCEVDDPANAYPSSPTVTNPPRPGQPDNTRVAMWEIHCFDVLPFDMVQIYYWGTEAQAYRAIDNSCGNFSDLWSWDAPDPPPGTPPGTRVDANGQPFAAGTPIVPSASVRPPTTSYGSPYNPFTGPQTPYITPPSSGGPVSGGSGIGWNDERRTWIYVCNTCFANPGNGCAAKAGYASGSSEDCYQIMNLQCNGTGGYCL